MKHNAALARSVVEMGGLELILGCMEEFDSGVKEAAAFVLGYIARQDTTLALAVVASGKLSHSRCTHIVPKRTDENSHASMRLDHALLLLYHHATHQN